MSFSRSDLKTTMYHEFLQSGDVVVGAYTEDGKQFKSGITPDDKVEIERKREILARSAQTGGGQLLAPIKASIKSGKAAKPIKVAKRDVKIKSDNPEPLTPAITAQQLKSEHPSARLNPILSTSSYSQTVYLHNKLGKIKMKVENVLSCEMAYCLVFNSEDDVIFTPNPGETLSFIDADGDSHEVYYANTLFNWTDGVKRIMILFKRDE